MLYEIQQIQRWFAANLPGCSLGQKGQVIGLVPEGHYQIPIGANPVLYYVEIKDGYINIGGKVADAPKH